MTKVTLSHWQKVTTDGKNRAKPPVFGKNRFGRVLAGIWQTPNNPWQGFGGKLKFTF